MCAKSLSDQRSWITGSGSRPGCHQQGKRYPDRDFYFQTEALRCFFPECLLFSALNQGLTEVAGYYEKTTRTQLPWQSKTLQRSQQQAWGYASTSARRALAAKRDAQ